MFWVASTRLRTVFFQINCPRSFSWHSFPFPAKVKLFPPSKFKTVLSSHLLVASKFSSFLSRVVFLRVINILLLWQELDRFLTSTCTSTWYASSIKVHNIVCLQKKEWIQGSDRMGTWFYERWTISPMRTLVNPTGVSSGSITTIHWKNRPF